MKLKPLLIKTLIYRLFISLPFTFFLTFLFFRNFVRSIEFTITTVFSLTFLLVGFEYVYQLKNKTIRNFIIGGWFVGIIIACVILKMSTH